MFKPVLGLDLGMTTLGICVSRSGHLATSLANLKFPNGDFDYAYPRVLQFVEEEFISKIILGRPCYPSGDPTEMTFVVEKFKEELRKRLDAGGFKKVEIELQDEQGSTLEAAANLHDLNLDAKKQKKIIDQNAAKVILERWLRKNGYDVW